MKTLYFEGAGIVPRGEVENCRIRTAFRNTDGEIVYLEMSGSDKAYEFITGDKSKAKQIFGSFGWIDHCFITRLEADEQGEMRWTDCNKYGCDYPRRANENVNYTFEYTKQGILDMVNTHFKGCFEEVVILPALSGYRVHNTAKNRQNLPYNLMDEFHYDVERTKQAEKIQKHIYDKEKARGVKYPCFSIWWEDDTLNVKYFDGRGQFEIPDVFKFDFA